MYPKNAASPQRVAIGPVVQISDGAVQTTGVSVKVMPQGGAASAGGGTIAYEEGIVHYVPTQAETNYASFMLIAYKTGCIPASVTVVTTISSTAGHAGLDWANVIGPTTTVGLTNTTVGTITTYTGNTPQTGDSFARIGATGSGLTSLASQSSVNTIDDFLDTEIAALTTELAKVPKSDSTVTWNATALASIQQEATDALNAYDPPTNAEMEARTLVAANYATATALDTVDNFLDTEIADIQARLPAALVGGRIDANVGAISSDSVAADNCEAFFDGTGYAGTGNTIPTVTNVTTVNGLAANVITAASMATDAGAEIADAVWDEAISGHQTTGTAGRSLTLAGAIIDETTSTGTPTTTTLQLTAGSTTDDFYNDLEIVPTSGTLAGQARIITDYTGATRTVTIDEPWTSAPASGISVLIRAQHNHSKTQIADAILTRQMTESYASDGTAPTLAQALCLIQQTIGDFSISGTTLTVKKLDGSTTAATYTLDSSTAPTSRTRST